MQPHSVLVTVTGFDRPGVTSALFAALAAHDVEVLDVEQLVLRGRMVLGVVLALHGDPGHLRRAAMHAAEALGVEIDITITEDSLDPTAPPLPRSHIMVLGRPLRAGAVGEIARRIADLGGAIESITRLADGPYGGLEVLVTGAGHAALTSTLITAARETGTDIAVQPAELRRCSKRLVLLDAERTLMPVDTLGLLAELAGRGAESARLLADVVAPRDPDAAPEQTESDQRETELLRARTALLAGLPVGALDEARAGLHVAPGTQAMIGALRQAGFRCGVISSGVAQVVEPLLDGLGLDFAAANRLEVSAGRLTGRLVGGQLDRPGRAGALVRFAQGCGVPLGQTVAVGAGTGDVDLVRGAGLGIAIGTEPERGRGGEGGARSARGTEPRYAHTLLFVLGLRRQDADEPDRAALPAAPGR